MPSERDTTFQNKCQRVVYIQIITVDQFQFYCWDQLCLLLAYRPSKLWNKEIVRSLICYHWPYKARFIWSPFYIPFDTIPGSMQWALLTFRRIPSCLTILFNLKKKNGKKTYYQLLLVIYKYIYTRDTAVQNEIVNRWMRKHKKTYTNRHKLSHERMQ